MRRIALVCLLGLFVSCGGVLSGCGPGSRRPPAVAVRWLAGRSAPEFDPGGPADPLRRALEGLLSHGLYTRDSAGVAHAAAVEHEQWSADRRTLTLRLRDDLQFTDGTRAGSSDFRDALLAGLAREDHSTAAWLLSPLTGLGRVRPGRPLPALGIEAPDSLTLVLHLDHPDSTFVDRLACPGIGVPWKRPAVRSWSAAVGLGPYRVLHEQPGRGLTLVRTSRAVVRRATVDTLKLSFAIGAPRVRYALRHQLADLVWPLPPGLLAQPIPAGYQPRQLAAEPPRRLMLVFRCDVRPTSALPARAALAHAFNRSELLARFGMASVAAVPWLEGAGAFEAPRFDEITTREWLTRGGLGNSFHVVLSFDADGAGAEIAPRLQGQWSRLGLYAELKPVRGAEALAEPLRPSAAQVQLVEAQAPLPGAPAELATLVRHLRFSAIGSFRTGWRTREFDPWVASPRPPAGFDAVAAQSRLAEEIVALPLATLPWRWVSRDGGGAVRFDPAVGPVFVVAATGGGTIVTLGPGSR